MEIVRLNLSSLKQDAALQVVVRDKGKPFTYDLKVLAPGEIPRCDMTQTDPEGNTVGPAEVFLEGAGNWTTSAQNPAQSQEKGLSIYFGHVYTGGELTFLRGDTRQRMLINGRIETIKEVAQRP